MLELEGRLASACKEARAFQHRAVDAERASAEATNSLAAQSAKVTAMQTQLDAITTERNAFKDKVLLWAGGGLACALRARSTDYSPPLLLVCSSHLTLCMVYVGGSW